MSLAFVGIAFGQVYIPTGLSSQSGIVRNVPTSVVRWPANAYLSDGNRAYVAAQLPAQLSAQLPAQLPAQVYNLRSNANDRNQYSNDQDESIRRYISADTEDRLRNFLRASPNPDSDLRQSLSNSYEDRQSNDRDNYRVSSRGYYNNDEENSRQRNSQNWDQYRENVPSGQRYNNDDNDNDQDNSNNNSQSNNNNQSNRYNNRQRENDDSDRSNRSRNRSESNQSNNQN